MRIALKFSREGSARFMSHLDMQRMFARALRRAKLPLKYSEGFNPHIVMSFASALPVGMATLGDYLELQTTEDISPSEAALRVGAVLPSGMAIVSGGALKRDESKLMAAVRAARYELTSPDPEGFFRSLRELLSRESVTVTKPPKKPGGKPRVLDIRPLVLDIRQESMTVTLALSGESSLSPALLMGELGDVEADFRRLDLLCMQEGELRPMECLFVRQ